MVEQGAEPPYAEIRQIIEHFKAVPHVPNEALQSYCEREHLRPMTENDYEDWLYQYHADIRAEAFVKDAMKVLSRYQTKRALSTQAEKDTVDQENDGIEIDLCDLLEKHEVPYDRQIDNMMQEFAGALATLVRNASMRASNMGAAVLASISEEQLGSPLSFKRLGEEYRRRHELAVEKKKGEMAAEKPEEEKPVDEPKEGVE